MDLLCGNVNDSAVTVQGMPNVARAPLIIPHGNAKNCSNDDIVISHASNKNTQLTSLTFFPTSNDSPTPPLNLVKGLKLLSCRT
jgi:hypothetical protein